MKRLAALALALGLLAPTMLVGCGGEEGAAPAETPKVETPKTDGEPPKAEGEAPKADAAP